MSRQECTLLPASSDLGLMHAGTPSKKQQPTTITATNIMPCTFLFPSAIHTSVSPSYLNGAAIFCISRVWPSLFWQASLVPRCWRRGRAHDKEDTVQPEDWISGRTRHYERFSSRTASSFVLLCIVLSWMLLYPSIRPSIDCGAALLLS